jgi:peptide/histidine transporter 3/4
VCLKLTIAISLGILYNNVLIKEPVTQNPFKIVYGVIKYAMKHKSPRLRSAFTYTGEEELPSRIDFGKSKYGGPFTTEQVEDVKTLFRVVLVFGLGCAFFGMTAEERSISNNLKNIFIRALSHTPEYVFDNFYSITGLVLVPLYEIVVHPLFRSYLPIIQSHMKFFIGFTLRIIRDVIMLALMTYACHHYAHITPSSNATLSCIFNQPRDSPNYLSDTLDYRWIILLEALVAISELLVAIGGLEFYCAQVPYSMKGLVAGIFYGLLVFFMMLSQALVLPITMTSLEWGTGTLSCGFWYILTILIYLFIVMAASVLVMRWYKKRKREDVLPNEQIFAERYYSRNM